MNWDLFWWTCHKPRIIWSDPNLYYSMAVIIFNPVFWNVAARLEYRKKLLTRLFGSPYKGCTLLGSAIMFLSVLRMRRFQLAVENQYRWPLLETDAMWMIGSLVLAIGLTLGTSSLWKLGFFGTVMGDYFGILMDEKVTSFPFNVCNNPMYVGVTLEYVGAALQFASPAGLLLAALVGVMYSIAICSEEPFTERIYAERAAEEKKKEK
ncbi:phosphatidylethanolamine N-methyltransferase-like [Diadema antillarum]|uniref:phosphatidylethanolamine N-methyltransferase-like n=1 Tax=Diadema antillarum TaxID=105358 RepID=UPI003A876F81